MDHKRIAVVGGAPYSLALDAALAVPVVRPEWGDTQKPINTGRRTEFDPPHLRGTGRTTKQMQNAPKGAIYVWVNQYTGWARDLAASLGRDDLVIVPLSYLDTIDKLAGRHISGIILDHATNLTDRQFDNYCWALTRVKV